MHPTAQAPAPDAAAAALAAAFAALVAALRQAAPGPAAGAAAPEPAHKVAARCAQLWQQHLLAGEGQDLAALVGAGSPQTGSHPVLLERVGVHLVCPHHLTVAFGTATLAYLPAGSVAGLGSLARLLEASCARLVLQEEASAQAAAAVVQALNARAAVVRLQAAHPCHRLLVPRSHAAKLITFGEAGDPAGVRQLHAVLAGARGRGRGGRRPAPSLHPRPAAGPVQ